MSDLVCRRCGIPKPESVTWAWAVCGDGPRDSRVVHPLELECAYRQLETAKAAAFEQSNNLTILDNWAQLRQGREWSCYWFGPQHEACCVLREFDPKTGKRSATDHYGRTPDEARMAAAVWITLPEGA